MIGPPPEWESVGLEEDMFSGHLKNRWHKPNLD